MRNSDRAYHAAHILSRLKRKYGAGDMPKEAAREFALSCPDVTPHDDLREIWKSLHPINEGDHV